MHEKEAKTILSTQNGINLYRGCTHGCIYCDARTACGRMTTPFEDVEVKVNAPELLETALRRKRGRCMIVTGSMSDPYQPCEEERKLMRRCLEVIDRYGFGVSVRTKSDLILRDLDLLQSINRKSRCIVQTTLTAADDALCAKLEPDVCPTSRRVEMLNRMKEAGIPTIVWLSPVLPFITDTRENLERLLEYCVEARVYGVLSYGAGLTLRGAQREYFFRELPERFPGLPERYEKAYGEAAEMPVPEHAALEEFIHSTCQSYHIEDDAGTLLSYIHAFVDREAGEQLNLFDLFGT